ncbi:hypothetical protein FRC05_007908, partial [Tulasnella sp. 425]
VMPALLDVPSSSRAGPPAVPALPLPMSSPSLQQEGSRPEQRTCFGLSLTQKSLRVICAPKNCTPAILASVRSAWPRGVAAEVRPEVRGGRLRASVERILPYVKQPKRLSVPSST